jgi:hypothetical protein
MRLVLQNHETQSNPDALPAPDTIHVGADGRMTCNYSGLVEVFDGLGAMLEAHDLAASEFARLYGVRREQQQHVVARGKRTQIDLSDHRADPHGLQAPAARAVG